MYLSNAVFKKKQAKLAFTLVPLLLFLNWLTPSLAVHAAPLSVNTFADELNTNGQCSLREAITNANNDNQSGSTDCAAGSGDDVINLPAGTYTLTRTGIDEDNNATGDLDISSNVTLAGAGAATTIIDGNGTDRVLHIRSSVVVLSDLTIQNGDSTGLSGPGANQKERGGGILNEGGTAVTLNRCSILSNTGRGGGGINNLIGTMTINDSTIANNSAQENTGGVHNQATLNINTSTISGNDAAGTGGGISTGNNGTPTININNSTIANNSADDGGGIYQAVGTVNIQNSLVADNIGTTLGPDCSGSLNSQDYNLVEDVTDCTITGTTINNTTGSDPQLVALADNGGETATHALGGTSPALEQIPDGTNGCTAGTSTDQRGGVRADGANRGGSACEIGAYEFDSSQTPTAVTVQHMAASGNSDYLLLATAVFMTILSLHFLKKKH